MKNFLAMWNLRLFALFLLIVSWSTNVCGQFYPKKGKVKSFLKDGVNTTFVPGAYHEYVAISETEDELIATHELKYDGTKLTEDIEYQMGEPVGKTTYQYTDSGTVETQFVWLDSDWQPEERYYYKYSISGFDNASIDWFWTGTMWVWDWYEVNKSRAENGLFMGHDYYEDGELAAFSEMIRDGETGFWRQYEIVDGSPEEEMVWEVVYDQDGHPVQFLNSSMKVEVNGWLNAETFSYKEATIYEFNEATQSYVLSSEEFYDVNDSVWTYRDISYLNGEVTDNWLYKEYFNPVSGAGLGYTSLVNGFVESQDTTIITLVEDGKIKEEKFYSIYDGVEYYNKRHEYFDHISDIPESREELAVSISPNPASNVIHFSNMEITPVIRDLQGRIMEVECGHGKCVIQNLAKGMYVLDFTTQSVRFIKE